MKGVSFQNGIEFKIVIEGETWSQGDTLCGKLEGISRNPNQTAKALKVYLAEGNDKKVKAKTAGAFKILAELKSDEASLSWSFPLSLTARVSDGKGSLYIVYGNGDALETMGQLRLNIVPHLHLRDLSDVLSSHFRFVTKSITAGKDGWTEMKLEAPSAKEWAFLDLLVLQVQITAETLEAKFIFHRKEVDAMKAGLSTKITQREVERAWDLPKLIHDFNQRLNKEAATGCIENVFSEYSGTGGWLG